MSCLVVLYFLLRWYSLTVNIIFCMFCSSTTRFQIIWRRPVYLWPFCKLDIKYLQCCYIFEMFLAGITKSMSTIYFSWHWLVVPQRVEIKEEFGYYLRNICKTIPTVCIKAYMVQKLGSRTRFAFFLNVICFRFTLQQFFYVK